MEMLCLNLLPLSSKKCGTTVVYACAHFYSIEVAVGTLTFSKETIERFEKLFSTVNSKFD